jgi:hypothetical protein
MTTILTTLVNREYAGSSGSYRLSSIGATATADIRTCLIARIGFCHTQAMKAHTSQEAQEWRAEEQGLIDALLKRDCTYEYQNRPGLLERYVTGLNAGAVLIRAASIRPSCRHRYGRSFEQFEFGSTKY